jgi:hypothetical protein
MPAVTTQYCYACGKSHDFCLDNASMFDVNYKYQYTCPIKDEVAHLDSPADWNEVDGRCPKGSVILKQVDK